MANDKVILIFDASFGEDLRSIVGLSPIWIVESRDNSHVARDLGQGGANVTIFRSQRFVQLLDTVDQHHPNWVEFEVIGENLSDEARGEVKVYSVSSIEPTTKGFLVRRRVEL